MRYAAMSAAHLPSCRDTFSLIPSCSGRINSVSTDFDDSLGSGGDFAVEEVLHLLEFKLTAGSDRHERRQPRHSKSTDNFKVFRMRL